VDHAIAEVAIPQQQCVLHGVAKGRERGAVGVEWGQANATVAVFAPLILWLSFTLRAV
jgi:hypothetical protein